MMNDVSTEETEVFKSTPLKLKHITLSKRKPWLQATVIALIASPSVIELLAKLGEFAYVSLAFPTNEILAWDKPASARPKHFDLGQDWSHWLHPVGQTRLDWLLTPGAPPVQHMILMITDVLALAIAVLLGVMIYRVIAARRAYRQSLQVSDAHGTAHIAQVAEFGRYALEPRNEFADSWRMAREAWREQQHQPPAQITNYIVGREEGTKMQIGLRREALESHVLGDATTGGGKTATQIAPALLRETGFSSWITTSVKGDLWKKTSGATSRQQKVWHFTLIDPEHCNGFDPLEAITTFEQATQFAESWVTNTGRSGAEGVFWDREAEKLLTMLVWHLHVTEPESCFPRLIELVHLEYEPTRVLLTGSPDPDVAMMAYKAFDAWDSDPRTRGNVTGDAAARFKNYLGPLIRRVTSRRDIHLAQMAREPIGLYLSMAHEQMETYRALYATLMRQLLDAWLATAKTYPEERLPHGATMYLDEFANLGKLPNFTSYLTTTRSAGIAMVLMIQDRAQLAKVYGEYDAEIITSGCKTHIVFSGCAPADAKVYSEQLGDMTIQHRQSGDSQHDTYGGSTSRGVSETGRRLLFPNEIVDLPRDMVLLLPERRSAMMVRTQSYKHDPRLKKLASLPPPVIEGPPAPPMFTRPPKAEEEKKPPRRPPTKKRSTPPPTPRTDNPGNLPE